MKRSFGRGPTTPFRGQQRSPWLLTTYPNWYRIQERKESLRPRVPEWLMVRQENPVPMGGIRGHRFCFNLSLSDLSFF